MPEFVQHLLPRDWQPGQAAAAGIAATLVYSLAMKVDQYITGNRVDDVKFIQGLLGDTNAARRRTAALAWGLHFLNGALLGEVYAALGKRVLPGPAWLRGAIFGEAFILTVWPLTPLIDRSHPMVKDGRLPRLANWTSLWQNLLRHLAFGLTLGLLYRPRPK